MHWLSKNKKILLAAALICLAALVVPNIEFLSVDNMMSFAEISIWLTALGFILLYVIKGFAIVIPSSLLYIGAGLAFPTWSGILITYTGLMIALTIGYFVGKKLGEEKVAKMLSKHKKVAEYLNGNKERMLTLCFMARLLHMPFGFVSLFLGALNMPFFKFLFMSLLGVSPIMIPTIFAGSAIANPFSSAFLVPFGISLAITLVVLIAYKTKAITKPRIAVLLILIQTGFFIFFVDRVTFLFPVVAILSYAVSFTMVLFIVKRDKTAAYKIIWIIIIMLLPIVGGMMYLLFGNNRPTRRIAAHVKEHALIAKLLDSDDIPQYERFSKNPRMAAIMKYIQRTSSYHPYINTDTTYYPMGKLMFEDMMNELQKAGKFIFMEYFIISKSGMWDRILEVLLNKAKEGVDVRLIFDDVGSLGLFNSAYLTSLEVQNIKILRFNPIVPFIYPFMNNRNHRKIMVIDGHTAFTGGINIADEYINLNNRLGVWKDTGVRLRGDAVWSFTLMFIETWNAFGKKNNERIDNFLAYKCPDIDAQIKKLNLTDAGLIIPYGDSPLGSERLGENIYIDILGQAQRYVYIFTPYLIISEKMMYAIQMAAKRGVDVRIITPGKPDKPIIYRLTRSYYKFLLGAGVRIYEYTPGFLHAKSLICDDLVAVVGTINLDYRSLYLHFECAALLYNSGAIADIKKDALNTIAESKEVLPGENKRLYHELFDAVLHLFSPLL